MFEAGRTRREVARAIDLLGLPHGARVLDCPCGQGRHAHLLAAAGFRVTGADASPVLLGEAAATSTARLRFARADMRRLPARWRGRFDGVASLGASFGFFATPAEDEQVIASYARVLRPGGVLVLHAPSRDGVVSRFIARDWWEAADGTLVLHERTFDPLSGVLTVDVRLRRGARTRRRAYRMRVYSAAELAAMCARHGLVVTEAYDGWRDRPLRRRSAELVLRGVRDG